MKHIQLFDVATGKLFAAAPHSSLLASSVPLGWRGFVVEWHRLEPQELPEHYVVGHGMSVSTCRQPIRFGWGGSARWSEAMLNPAECHILTHGEHNRPRWLDTFDGISIVLDRRLVADLVRDGLAEDRVEFQTQRSRPDHTIARYAETFRSEMLAGGPSGPLYAETLAVGLALHLLGRYAVRSPAIPRVRGKLTSLQLRSVLDYVQDHLAQSPSLLELASLAHISAFHFARAFRASVGLSPHQYVLRQRLQKAVCLMKSGKVPLTLVALECGFHDQPHFTRAFRRVLGTTPGVYMKRP